MKKFFKVSLVRLLIVGGILLVLFDEGTQELARRADPSAEPQGTFLITLGMILFWSGIGLWVWRKFRSRRAKKRQGEDADIK